MENENKVTQKELEDAHKMIQYFLTSASVYQSDCYLLIKAAKNDDGKITFSLVSSSIDLEQAQHLKEMNPTPNYMG